MSLELPSEFKLIKLEESEPFKQLTLALVLEEFLMQVKDFTAMSKLERLFYKPIPKDSPSCTNKHHNDLKLTEYSYFISQKWGNNFYFSFSKPNDGAYGNRTNLEFDIEVKTIPSVIEGLAIKKDQLQSWLADYDKCEPYFHGLEREIEKHFDKAMTAKGFNTMREAVADRLEEYAKEVRKLKGKP